MHEGFRAEEWVVRRTPVNTPTAATASVGVGVREEEGGKLVVGMVNLSDEEEEEEEERGEREEAEEEDETRCERSKRRFYAYQTFTVVQN